MIASDRRKQIILHLKQADAPISASVLAKKLHVSRQIIVSDVALLRTAGNSISATPKGYVLENSITQLSKHNYEGLVACQHTGEQLREELYAIIDFGGEVINVTVEHGIYGEISAKLNLSSRYEADQFIEKVSDPNALPLSSLTGGIHLHKIGCKDKDTFHRICTQLEEKGILIK